MAVNLGVLKQNTREQVIIGDIGKSQKDPKYVKKVETKNQLNDLEFVDWIRHTRSFHVFHEKHPIDVYKLHHPATFEEEFVFYYLELFSKPADVIFDPFLGSGTTVIVANVAGRRGAGIEINPHFVQLIYKRLEINNMLNQQEAILQGDARQLLETPEFREAFVDKFGRVKLTITSPPYFNMLCESQNMKLNHKSENLDYGTDPKNLGNLNDYQAFINALLQIFSGVYEITQDRGYLVIEVQNFYFRKKFQNGQTGMAYQFFAWDLAIAIANTRWIPCGEQVWCFPTKKCFPFGYPNNYQSNIHHSYVLIFQKHLNKK
jgi:hypothetical protein